MRRCHHPNLVECLGFFHGEDELALLMTLAPGGDCQQLLQRHGALSERAATAIVQQLAGALHYMHTGPGVLHRDVKLENVLVSDVGYTATGTPRIKLCDFGHSCLLEGSCHGAARDDGFRGTQGYAAPEVAQPGAPPLWTTAADVWGVGVVYYALLANEVRPPSPPPPARTPQLRLPPLASVCLPTHVLPHPPLPLPPCGVQLLRWKGGVPDVSSKTSRAFATTSATTRVQIKELLLPELSERASLKTILDTVNATAAAQAPVDEAPSAGGLRRHSTLHAGGMRRVFSLSADLAGLGALGAERAIRQPSRVLPSSSSSFATSSSIGTDLADAADDDDAAADWGQAEVQSEVQAGAKEARAEAPSSAAASAASAPVTTPLAAANGLWVPPSPGAVTGAGLWIPVTSAVLGVRSPLPPLPPPSAATSSAASSASSPTGNRPPAVEVPPQQARGLGAVPGGVVPGSCAFSDGGGDAAASTASAASLPTPPLPLASLTSPLPAPSPTHVGIASPMGPASEVVSPGERPPLTSTASKSERTAALLASISRAHAAQAQRSY